MPSNAKTTLISKQVTFFFYFSGQVSVQCHTSCGTRRNNTIMMARRMFPVSLAMYYNLFFIQQVFYYIIYIYILVISDCQVVRFTCGRPFKKMTCSSYNLTHFIIAIHLNHVQGTVAAGFEKSFHSTFCPLCSFYIRSKISSQIYDG